MVAELLHAFSHTCTCTTRPSLLHCLLIPTVANDLYFQINVCTSLEPELPQCELLNAHVSILGKHGRGYTRGLQGPMSPPKVCHTAGAHCWLTTSGRCFSYVAINIDCSNCVVITQEWQIKYRLTVEVKRTPAVPFQTRVYRVIIRADFTL